MAMVRIKRYLNVTQAQMHASLLASEGIPAHVDGVNSSVNVGFAIDAGGIGLWVPENVAVQALEIIEDIEPIAAEDEDVSSSPQFD